VKARRNAGWAETTIGEICHLVNGRAFKPSDWTEDGLPIVRIQNLNRADASFNHYSGPVEDKFLIRPGELLFAWSGTPGTSFGAHVWSGGRAVLNQHIFKVEFDEQAIDKRFFAFAINQTLDDLIAQAHGGVGLRHVTKGVFEATPIGLPPLPEQRRIVAKLDQLSARSRAARDHLARTAKLAARAKQAILAAEFEKSTGTLRDLSPSTFYGPRFAKSAYVADGIPTLRTTDFRSDGAIRLSDAPRVSVAERDFGKWGLIDGDILVTRTGSIGKCAVYEAAMGPALPSAYLIRLRFDLERADPWFVYFALASPSGQRHLGSSATAITQPNVNAEAILSVPFPQVTLNVQRDTVRRIRAAFARIDRMTADAARAAHLLDRLDERLLAKAFRGELVPHDPADEPAEALLARIRAARDEAPRPRRGRRAAPSTR
jgi:type I restriction enzyme, S subunit